MMLQRKATRFSLTASLILSVAIFVLLTTKALALQVASKAYEPSSTASRLFMSPTSAPLLNDHTRPASPFRDVHARNLHSKLSSLSRDSSQRPSNLSSSYSSAIKVPIHRLPLVSITAPSAVSVSAITHSDETNQETIAGGGRSRGNGFGTGGMGKGGGSDFGDGGNGGDGGDINGGDESDGGNGSGGRGRDGHFQYAKLPQVDTYEFGFRKGNLYNFIERHESRHGPRFRTNVLWGDKRGGYGEHYWEYNHMEITPTPTTPGYSEYNVSSQY